jgi:hypothetical protein
MSGRVDEVPLDIAAQRRVRPRSNSDDGCAPTRPLDHAPSTPSARTVRRQRRVTYDVDLCYRRTSR